MKRTIVQLTALSVFSLAAVGCQLREPFEATVVAAGVDGDKVRAGIFERDFLYAGIDGVEQAASFESDYQDHGRVRPTFIPDATQQFELEPLSLIAEAPGHYVFSLLDPPPSEEKALAIIAWVDDDDDGLLDLRLDAPSETARTIYLFNSEDNSRAYLWAYNFTPDAEGGFYNATALTGPAENVIIAEANLKGWMAILPSATEGPDFPSDDEPAE